VKIFGVPRPRVGRDQRRVPSAALLLGDGLGWRITAATFDRERLTTGAGS
jgi:alkylation response protein AidB-like acyl-CoA dehydrogenase